MDRRIGPYHYADGWMAQKRFPAEDGTSVRTFTVVVAAAYNAGIIGPEHNGLAILDEDNQSVVLDQHLCASTGYYGPSKEQKAEFRRVMDMDWETFSKFCRTNPRYRRGAAPDIEAGRAPDFVEESALREAIRTGKASKKGLDIRTEEMKALDDETLSEKTGGLSFPCRTREQMIVHIARHHTHKADHHGPWLLAWDVKVRNFDTSGDVEGGEAIDPRFDARWREHLDEHGDAMFWQACESALSDFVDGDYDTYPGDDGGGYKFVMVGRSSGHLALTAWDGPQPASGHYPMSFRDQGALIDYLRELSPQDLCRLYKLVANVDHDVRNPAATIEAEFNFRRSEMESQWAAEAAPAP